MRLACNIKFTPLPQKKKKKKKKISTKIFPMSTAYTDKCGIKQLYHRLSACTEDNPLDKARGLSPRTDGQTMV